MAVGAATTAGVVAGAPAVAPKPQRDERLVHSAGMTLAQEDRSRTGRRSRLCDGASRRDFLARSVADLSCPQAAMMSSPRGVRIGEA